MPLQPQHALANENVIAAADARRRWTRDSPLRDRRMTH
jgi:hypothetical protein